MVCTRCGRDNPEENEFCGRCGTDLKDAIAAVAEAEDDGFPAISRGELHRLPFVRFAWLGEVIGVLR